MNRKSKFILGLESKRFSNSRKINFTDEEKRYIIEDYMSSGKSKKAIWYKYTGYQEEHGAILRWMREFGYLDNKPVKRSTFISNSLEMKHQSDNQKESFETLQLKKRIEDLEKQLKDAEMKAIAFSTMVDVAEKELNISIRKKYNTKPSKK